MAFLCSSVRPSILLIDSIILTHFSRSKEFTLPSLSEFPALTLPTGRLCANFTLELFKFVRPTAFLKITLNLDREESTLALELGRLSRSSVDIVLVNDDDVGLGGSELRRLVSFHDIVGQSS
jgi:hypothetical protein